MYGLKRTLWNRKYIVLIWIVVVISLIGPQAGYARMNDADFEIIVEDILRGGNSSGINSASSDYAYMIYRMVYREHIKPFLENMTEGIN